MLHTLRLLFIIYNHFHFLTFTYPCNRNRTHENIANSVMMCNHKHIYCCWTFDFLRSRTSLVCLFVFAFFRARALSQSNFYGCCNLLCANLSHTCLIRTFCPCFCMVSIAPSLSLIPFSDTKATAVHFLSDAFVCSENIELISVVLFMLDASQCKCCQLPKLSTQRNV